MNKETQKAPKKWSWFTRFSQILLLVAFVALIFAFKDCYGLYTFKADLATPAPNTTNASLQIPLISEVPPSPHASTQTPEEFAANIKLDISTKHQDGLTRFSDLIFWYATFTTGLSAFFLVILFGTLIKTNKDFDAYRLEIDKLNKKKKAFEDNLAKEKTLNETASAKLLEKMEEELESIKLLNEHSSILINYYANKWDSESHTKGR
ncbi:hypothetical protein [Desulfovibrio cuneatus]|uniref:hypothetical protein n=1 Tax=Desulfovibrio cuneatus TaxID=159728 RepID=UPI00040283FB|nr:hypothetical protein [Desulfovibrio cuneatus]